MLTSPTPQSSGNTDPSDQNPFGTGMSIADIAAQLSDNAAPPRDTSPDSANPDSISGGMSIEAIAQQLADNAEADTGYEPSAYDPSVHDPSSYGLNLTGETVTYDETAIAQAYATAFDREIAQAEATIATAPSPSKAHIPANIQSAEKPADSDTQRIPPFSSTFPPEPAPHASERLLPFLKPEAVVQWDPAEIAIAPLPVYSQGMLANAYFFGNPRWNKKYLEEEHRGSEFGDRWQHALRRINDDPFDLSSGWDNRVVVDLGCGPGNLFQTLGGNPATLIGIDISYGALRRAQQLGYTALLADAHHLPLRDGIADVVVANALLHHCDDMARVLSEAARLVKPGGYLITDLDPQRSAWDRRGWGLWLQQLRLPSFPGFGDSVEEKAWRIATEVHNRQPGVGIKASLYAQVLEPWGFDVQLYRHNNCVGAEVFLGEKGRSPLMTRLSQRLSGLDPEGAEAAQSILCVAHRTP